MTYQKAGLLTIACALGLAACGGSSTAPSPVQEQGIAAGLQSTGSAAASGIAVAGTVNDAAWRPLPFARVEVIAGAGVGLATTASATGRFDLAGPFDETTRFRASSDGYVSIAKPLPTPCPPCNPDWWIHFYLESELARTDIAGDYILTFTANPSCSLPDEARTRTYAATIAPAAGSADAAGSRFDVRVNTPRILASFASFTIGVVGDYASFEIGDPGHSGAGLVEQVAPNRYVTLEGAVATVIVDPSAITTRLSGAVTVCEVAGAFSDPYGCGGPGGASRGRCHSNEHVLTLRRR